MTNPTDTNVPITRARSRAFIFGTLAIVLASATAYTAWWVVSGYESKLAAVEQDAGNVQIVVAARDLRPGQVISREDVRMDKRPPGTSLDQMFFSVDTVLGQTVGDKVLVGEPVRFERLTIGGADLHLNEVIDPGSRAVTIRASHSAAVGGLLRPGYFVDVIVTIRPDTKDLAADWVTETILQGVRVIAVNNDVVTSVALEKESTEQTRVHERDVFVTLEVEPAEAEQVALASSRGQIELALRARDDFDQLQQDGPLITNALLGLPEPVVQAQERRLERKRSNAVRIAPAPPADATPTQSMDIIRGGQTTVEQFDADGNRIPAAGRKP